MIEAHNSKNNKTWHPKVYLRFTTDIRALPLPYYADNRYFVFYNRGGGNVYSSWECRPTWLVTNRVAWGCNIPHGSHWKTVAELLIRSEVSNQVVWVWYLLWSKWETDPRWLSMKHHLFNVFTIELRDTVTQATGGGDLVVSWCI